jgi:hypothetical protein
VVSYGSVCDKDLESREWKLHCANYVVEPLLGVLPPCFYVARKVKSVLGLVTTRSHVCTRISERVGQRL